MANDFNVRLKPLLDELSSNLPGATFLYADAYNAQLHILDNYKQYGNLLSLFKFWVSMIVVN